MRARPETLPPALDPNLAWLDAEFARLDAEPPAPSESGEYPAVQAPRPSVTVCERRPARRE